MTAAIAHAEGDVAFLDCLVEVRAPHNPQTATAQIADTLRAYDLSRVVGDKYAAGWTVDAFAKCGITYEHSERDRSTIYLNALPLFTSGRVRLLDDKRMVAQFSQLERRTLPLGKDRVDHGVNGYDDLCNACAGAMVLATADRKRSIARLSLASRRPSARTPLPRSGFVVCWACSVAWR